MQLNKLAHKIVAERELSRNYKAKKKILKNFTKITNNELCETTKRTLNDVFLMFLHFYFVLSLLTFALLSLEKFVKLGTIP